MEINRLKDCPSMSANGFCAINRSVPFSRNAGISIPRGGDFTGTLANSMSGRPPQPNGFGCSAIRLGNAGGMGCGTLSGLEFGIGGLYGSSTVLSSGVEPCDCATGGSQ